MRGRIFITISDTREVRQYAVNRAVGRVVVYFLSGHALLLVLGLVVLAWMSTEIDALRFAREAVVREYRMATDEKARLEYQAKDELKRIEAEIQKKREELGIVKEVGKSMPDKAPTVDRAAPKDAAGPARTSFAPNPSMGRFIPLGAPMAESPMASGFGMRLHPLLGRVQAHNGVDFNVPPGTSVYATADGVVESAQNSHDGYGLMVMVRHPYGFRSAYAHLKRTRVAAGQVVRKGDLIADSGNSGQSTGPHLHYEIHYDERPLDPAPFVQGEAEPSRLIQRNRSVPWASLVAYHRP